jgi:hypothetical protein
MIASQPVPVMPSMWGQLLARRVSVQVLQKFFKRKNVLDSLHRATNVQQQPAALGAWEQANVSEMC